jgi:hypothetical protein
MNSHDPVLDHRARIERARLDAEERRARALQEQSAPENTPAVRVRVWENLHQVRLPKDPAHAILQIIARQTALDLTDVLEVQRQRALPATPASI